MGNETGPSLNVCFAAVTVQSDRQRVLVGFRDRNTTSSAAATQPHRKHTSRVCQWTMERAAVVSGCRNPSVPEYNISTSTLAFDQHFATTAKGFLLIAEIVSMTVLKVLRPEDGIINKHNILYHRLILGASDYSFNNDWQELESNYQIFFCHTIASTCSYQIKWRPQTTKSDACTVQ